MSDNYKIIADGTFFGIKIFAPNGEDITKHIRAYRLEHEAGELPRLTISMFSNRLESDIELPADQVFVEETDKTKKE